MNSDIISHLNPKTQTIAATIGGYGGLKPEDICHALSGLNKGSYTLGLAMHGYEDARKDLTNCLIESIQDKIKPLGTNYTRILALIAVHEEIGDSPCQVCKGRGFVYKQIEHPDQIAMTENGLLPTPCTAPQCVEGGYRMTDRERGELIAEAIDQNYTQSAWRNGWSWDLSEALSTLSEWQHKLNIHLGVRLER